MRTFSTALLLILPVSTTHAMTGAILGAALLMGGAGAVRWPVLATTVIAPLALGP